MEDIIIVGGGIGGLLCAHRLIAKAPHLKISLLEKGHDISERRCPIIEGEQISVSIVRVVASWKV